jgi:uncharacterized protein YbaP (TraB family)
MIRSGVFVLFAFAVLCGCARADDEINPALYVVRDADSTMYLYGTVHVRPAGADWGDADVRNALNATEEIWTEIEISSQADAETQALTTRYGLAPADQPLSRWLTAAESAKLDVMARRLGIPRQALERMQPWLAGLTLSLAPILEAGYDPQSGVDRAIDAYGEARGKRMRSFETAEQQISFLATLSPDLQRQMLREAILEADTGPAQIAEMTTAWEAGDEAALQRSVIDETRTLYPELYEILFVTRNRAWVETLVRELQGSGVDFVAVGAGHLIGDDGLVSQLRARGYEVTRVGD